jgi:hypothetical protein
MIDLPRSIPSERYAAMEAAHRSLLEVMHTAVATVRSHTVLSEPKKATYSVAAPLSIPHRANHTSDIAIIRLSDQTLSSSSSANPPRIKHRKL